MAAFGFSGRPGVVYAGSHPKTGFYRYDPLRYVARPPGLLIRCSFNSA
jgi:hypothetical protein